METIERDYAPKGVQFFYLYKALAHPELNGYVQPVTLKERLAHVAEAKRTLGTRFGWLVGRMDNDLKHALGDAPNCEFVIDPDGKIVVMRVWSRPEELRADLERLVGPVENPTRVADLDLPRQPRTRPASSNVVPRLELPGQMTALKVTAHTEESKDPFYVKLRPEADRDLVWDGEGKLYLGFHIDPIYHVHWNNLTTAIRYEVTGPSGILVTPAKGAGPDVEQESDTDPREFLVDALVCDLREPISVTVRYVVCNDAEGWCKPVTQRFTVHLKVDRDAGRPMRRR